MSDLNSLLKNHTSLYLIDLSWAMYRNFNAFINFGVDVEGYKIKTGHFYGLYTDIKAMIESEGNPLIIFCQDGAPVERKKLMEESGLEYKEGRPELEYNFFKDINKIKAVFCSIPNVIWAYNEDKESDDLLYALAKQAESCSDFKGHIYIYSGDNDLLQSISDRTFIVRKRVDKKFIPIDNFALTHEEQFTKKFHGVDSYHIVNYRSIVGDPSDKIPGISRFPRDIATNIAMNSDWKPETAREIKWHKIYQDSKSIVERNRKLMQLTSDFTVNLSKPNVNKEKVLDLLTRLQLFSCQKWLTEEGYL